MISLEPAVKQAVQKFITLIADRYNIDQVIVYGSRARGDHRPDSDVDVAVLLHGEPQRCLPVMWDVADDAFDILLETGFVISVMPIWLEEWIHPERHSNPDLLENIASEGVIL